MSRLNSSISKKEKTLHENKTEKKMKKELLYMIEFLLTKPTKSITL